MRSTTRLPPVARAIVGKQESLLSLINVVLPVSPGSRKGVLPMSGINICLFGRFCVKRNEQVLHGLDARKVQELFTYLLLHRGRPQSREGLAGLLWGDHSTTQSRKNLRQALWQLQAAL